MGKALPIVVALVLLVYAFFDLYATPRAQVRHMPKWAWFLLVLVPVFGPLLWLFFGSTQERRPPNTQPRRNGAVGPDDDPDFLRGL
ncbi:MAG TPA: PLD nuclease N-terminal domain-containing protein [Aeromicrobium sp.]|nr:PLD nuclease N-terminal domain-containing protein [Aeromicrobium sp.]